MNHPSPSENTLGLLGLTLVSSLLKSQPLPIYHTIWGIQRLSATTTVAELFQESRLSTSLSTGSSCRSCLYLFIFVSDGKCLYLEDAYYNYRIQIQHLYLEDDIIIIVLPLQIIYKIIVLQLVLGNEVILARGRIETRVIVIMAGLSFKVRAYPTWTISTSSPIHLIII